MKRLRWLIWLYLIPVEWMRLGGWRARFAERCFHRGYMPIEKPCKERFLATFADSAIGRDR